MIAQNGKELCLWRAEDDREDKNPLFPAISVSDGSVELCILYDIDPPQQVQENVFSYRNHVQLKVQGAIFGAQQLRWTPVNRWAIAGVKIDFCILA